MWQSEEQRTIICSTFLYRDSVVLLKKARKRKRGCSATCPVMAQDHVYAFLTNTEIVRLVACTTRRSPNSCSYTPCSAAESNSPFPLYSVSMSTNYFLANEPSNWRLQDAVDSIEVDHPEQKLRATLKKLKKSLQEVVEKGTSTQAAEARRLLGSWKVT